MPIAVVAPEVQLTPKSPRNTERFSDRAISLYLSCGPGFGLLNWCINSAAHAQKVNGDIAVQLINLARLKELALCCAVSSDQNFHEKKGAVACPRLLSGGDVQDGSEALGITNSHVIGDDAANAGQSLAEIIRILTNRDFQAVTPEANHGLREVTH